MIYQPDGSLIPLPVATFVTANPAAILAKTAKDADPDYRQVAWLGAKTDSALVLSAASFLQSRAFAPSRAPQSFLASADPSTPLGTLLPGCGRPPTPRAPACPGSARPSSSQPGTRARRAGPL